MMSETPPLSSSPTREEDDNHSTSQSTTLSELVRQLRVQLNVDELEERFRDEEDGVTPVEQHRIAPSPDNHFNDMDYYVTPNNNDYSQEEGARDFETVSSISRMSAITDVILLSDPELGGGRILALEPPQPDEATIERPMPPQRRHYNTIPPMHSDGAQLIEPPVRSIVTMGPVKDDPNFETIRFSDGVIKVRRCHKGQRENSSDKSTDDEDSCNDPSCDAFTKTTASCHPLLWRRLALVLFLALVAGASAAFMRFLFHQTPDNTPRTVPGKQKAEKAEDDSSDSAARDTDMFFTAPPTASPVPTAAYLSPAPTMTPIAPTMVVPVADNATAPPSEQQTTFATTLSSSPLPIQPTATPAETPTSSPTTFLGGIDAILADITNVALIRAPQSPQNLAYQFVMDTTQFSMHSPQRIRQRYIMAVLYYATNGNGWEHRTGWLQDSIECRWYSDNSSPCNDQGELVRLSLPGNNLIGEIPHELGFLSTLEEIVLRGNDLEGDIPATLGPQMTNLQNLDLSWTQVDGPIPSSLGQAVSLKRISLVNTAVNGSIPNSFGDLINLEELLVVKTDLTGSMPASVCALQQQSLVEVWADCDALDCPCCNYCCYEGQIEICQLV